jgi:hypothetical protein
MSLCWNGAVTASCHIVTGHGPSATLRTAASHPQAATLSNLTVLSLLGRLLTRTVLVLLPNSLLTCFRNKIKAIMLVTIPMIRPVHSREEAW